MRRHTPEHTTINKQHQENINNHLRKTRQQYSTHPHAASCSLTRSMHAAREGTRCCAESALQGSLIMKFITLALTLVPRLRYLWDRFRRPCFGSTLFSINCNNNVDHFTYWKRLYSARYVLCSTKPSSQYFARCRIALSWHRFTSHRSGAFSDIHSRFCEHQLHNRSLVVQVLVFPL